MIVGHIKAQERLLILFLPFLPSIGMNIWIWTCNNMKSDLCDLWFVVLGQWNLNFIVHCISSVNDVI